MHRVSILADAISAFQQGQLHEARKLLQALINSGPVRPQAHYLFGLVECRLGRLDQGVDWLRRATLGDPGNAAHRVMLARALVDAGRPRDAFEAASPPAGNTPAELALWHARAEAAHACGEWEAAEQAWRVVTAARGADWTVWASFGESLEQLEKWEAAIAALRRALELKPDDAKLRLGLSRALGQIGRTEESLEQLEAAARLVSGLGSADALLELVSRPDRSLDEGMLRELALMLERTNRVALLRDLLDAAHQRGIALERLGLASAAFALRENKPAEARRILEANEDSTDPVGWHRLMSRTADALGNPAMAFAAAFEMNRSVRDDGSWRKRGRDYRAQLRAWSAAMRSWPFELPTVKERPGRAPAFLVGFPRSGTTLADTFLMGHPDVAVLEERHLLGAAEIAFGDMRRLPDASPEQLLAARMAYLAELGRHVDSSFSGLVIDKQPLNMTGVPFIAAVFPDAKLIFAQRHPCDVVLSSFMQSFALNPAMASFLDVGDAADLYDAAMELFSLGRRRATIPVHDLVYEQLVDRPEATLRSLLEFLGLEWRPEILDHRRTAVARGAVITASYDQVVRPLSKTASGRWRRYEEQLEPVLPVLLPWAERLGYAD